VLKNNEHLSFVSAKKKGNRLEINLVLSKEKVPTLNGNVYELVADVDGVIEKIKVYRGTALFSVGDAVKSGDLLVGGYALIKEQTVKVNLLATVSVITEKEFYYQSSKPNQESVAEALAEQQLFEKEIISSQTTAEEVNGEYVYKTIIKYRRVYFAG
jgi:hypothetical protein